MIARTRNGTIVFVDAVATIMSDPTLLNRLDQCIVPSTTPGHRDCGGTTRNAESNALSAAMERDSAGFLPRAIVRGNARTAEGEWINARPVIGHLPFWLAGRESAGGKCSFDWPAGF